MTIRSRLSSIMAVIRLERLQLLALQLEQEDMMVLYRSPEYQAVQVNNEGKYQID